MKVLRMEVTTRMTTADVSQCWLSSAQLLSPGRGWRGDGRGGGSVSVGVRWGGTAAADVANSKGSKAVCRQIMTIFFGAKDCSHFVAVNCVEEESQPEGNTSSHFEGLLTNHIASWYFFFFINYL